MIYTGKYINCPGRLDSIKHLKETGQTVTEENILKIRRSNNLVKIKT